MMTFVVSWKLSCRVRPYHIKYNSKMFLQSWEAIALCKQAIFQRHWKQAQGIGANNVCATINATTEKYVFISAVGKYHDY